MFRSKQSEIQYSDLEYLACLAEEEHVREVIDRLSAEGIPVQVQSVSVHSTDHPPNCRFQLFVPHGYIDTAINVAFNGSETE